MSERLFGTDDITVFYELGEKLMKIYQSKLAEGKNNATGKLSRSSLDIDVKNGDNQIKLFANLMEHWFYIENGRKPTKNRGGNLYAAIRQWIDDKHLIPKPVVKLKKKGLIAKGIYHYTPTKEQMAHAITNKIHEKGYFTPHHHGKKYLEETLKEGKPIIEEMVKHLNETLGKNIKLEILTLPFIEKK